MLYLGNLKKINGDVYRAFHIICDHTKSCHTQAELEKTGVLVDHVLAKDFKKVFVNTRTKEVSYEFKAGKTPPVICTATAADITIGKTAVINGKLVTGTKAVAEVIK